MTSTLLIATHNQGKIAEYRLLLADLPLQVTSLADRGIDYEAPENGDTFAENACQKATTYAMMTGLLTWADDSGLEVDALDGRPGIQSARYGGGGLSDADRYTLLLSELEGTSTEGRSARFRCAICLALPSGDTSTMEDFVEGTIISEPIGAHGFGYDPVFYLPEQQMTMAQLPAETKNEISHRGKAARAAKVILSQMLNDGSLST